MARLNQIEIRESEVTYSNQREWFFHPTGHHVRELLLHFLPPGYVLDGSSKFCAIFGPRENGDETCYSILGVTVHYVEDFDVEEYMSRSIEEQQEIVLDALTTTMTNVAQSAGGDVDAIRNAAAAVRKHGFAVEIPVDKLAKSTRDRKLRVNIFRCLGPTIGEIWEARICQRDGAVIGVEPITANPGHLDRTDHYSKSKWSGSTFQIVYSRLDTIEFSLDTSKYQQESR